MFVKLKELPPIVKEALNKVGYHRVDILVEAAEEASLIAPYGDGYQSYAVAIDTKTNEISREVTSNWGGGGWYSPKKTLDRPGTLKLPENGMVIVGQRGGGRPVSAKLYAHPALLAPLLKPASAPEEEYTLAELIALVNFVALKPAYRPPIKPETLAKFIEKGLVKKNKAGALSITTAGKDLVGDYNSPVRQKVRAAGHY